MTRRQKYRNMLIAAIAACFLALGLSGYSMLMDSLPDRVYVDRTDADALDFLAGNPLVTVSEDLEAAAGDGSFRVTCSLLGAIPLKTVQVVPGTRPRVLVCGIPVGIYMETNGVMIVSTSEISTMDGLSANPAEHIVKAGDYIESVDGHALTDKRELMAAVADSGGSPMELLLNRDGGEVKVSVTPALSTDGSYKLGIWVRDNIQGIGTLTYVKEDGSFGALGHAISDVDTGEILNLREGELYLTEILSVIRGEQGFPGELQGVIHYEEQNRIGVITENSGLGIHGILHPGVIGQLPLSSAEIGYRQELTTGPAQILTCVDGEVKRYDAEVTDIDLSAENSNKCFSIRVTDPELIAATGGIVQGMSGSPILQNGRFVGAVTHVFVQDAARGYGIFAETMLEGSGG